jgi:hypothetical protein
MGSTIFRSDRTKLPKAEHDAKEWQAAMEALLLVAEHDGPTQFARIGDSESWRDRESEVQIPRCARFPIPAASSPAGRTYQQFPAFVFPATYHQTQVQLPGQIECICPRTNCYERS